MLYLCPEIIHYKPKTELQDEKNHDDDRHAGTSVRYAGTDKVPRR